MLYWQKDGGRSNPKSWKSKACEKEKAPTGTGERMSDDELKVALFGSLDIDNADLDDVKRYAALIHDKKRGKW